MRKRYTRPFWSSCWFTAFWLFATGRCASLVLTKSSNSRFPHLSGVTPRGHLIGFCLGRDPERAMACPLHPFWFYGQIGGVRKKHKHRIFGHRVILGKL